MFSPEANSNGQPMANTDTKNPNLALIDVNHSMFPMDNYDLENYRWEDDIIIDPTQMPSIPSTQPALSRQISMLHYRPFRTQDPDVRV